MTGVNGRERVTVALREKQPERPLDGRPRVEFDPEEHATTCDVCGSWGITDASRSRVENAKHDPDRYVACEECADQEDADARRVERIEVGPHGSNSDTAVVTLDGATRLVVDRADVDGSDNLTFYRENVSVAHVKVLGVPLEVPNLVRRAIQHLETGVWE